MGAWITAPYVHLPWENPGRGLVFDLADSFKDALVLPIAFSLAREKDSKEAERSFRGKLINAFDDREILKEAIGTVEKMIAAATPDKAVSDA